MFDFCKQYKQQIEQLKLENLYLENTVKGLLKERNDFQTAYQNLKKEYISFQDKTKKTIEEYEASYHDLLSKYENLLSQNQTNKEMAYYVDYYYNKYPETNILYSFQVENQKVDFDIKYFCLAGQNDYRLINFANTISTTKAKSWQEMDLIIQQIQNKVKVNYVSDANNEGKNEYWQTASETFSLNKGDCEDWTFLKYVLARLLGVDKGLLRVVCGLTYTGQGHATLYYLNSNKQWVHVEATSNYISTTDDYRIKDVWFSFNEEKAFSQFSEEVYNKFLTGRYSNILKMQNINLII